MIKSLLIAAVAAFGSLGVNGAAHAQANDTPSVICSNGQSCEVLPAVLVTQDGQLYEAGGASSTGMVPVLECDSGPCQAVPLMLVAPDGTPYEAGGGGGGTPGGANTQVQFNDGGAFGGDAGLIFDKTTDILSIGAELRVPGSSSYVGIGRSASGGTLNLIANGSTQATVAGGVIGATSFAAASGGSFSLNNDTILLRDAANVFAQRNGTTAQGFRIYNTFTDASNYERVSHQWTTNQYNITSEAAGTGTSRGMRLDWLNCGALMTNGLFRVECGLFLSPAKNSAQTAIIWSPGAGQIRLTDNTSADFGRLQFGGTTSAYPSLKRSSANLEARLADDSAYTQMVASTFNASSSLSINGDTILVRDAADTFAQRRSTNPQAFHLYNTFTDGSNYERAVMRYSSNRLEIGHDILGTGTARTVHFFGASSGAYYFNSGCCSTTAPNIRNESGFMQFYQTTTRIFALQSIQGSEAQGLSLADLSQVIWGANYFTPDVGIGRSAAGVLRITLGDTSQTRAPLEVSTLDTQGYTVATLPAAGNAGRTAHVTDQTTACPATGAALTGGGAVVCPVFDNGSAWVGG